MRMCKEVEGVRYGIANSGKPLCGIKQFVILDKSTPSSTRFRPIVPSGRFRLPKGIKHSTLAVVFSPTPHISMTSPMPPSEFLYGVRSPSTSMHCPTVKPVL